MSVKEGLETEGVSVPTFSGHAEDFAKFKREFEAVVVPNRYPLHVAAYLRAAVPTELESQLFDSLPFPDHIAMMHIPEENHMRPPDAYFCGIGPP